MKMFKVATEKDIARFMKKTVPMPNGCLLWDAAINENGYGYFRFGKKMVRAHRFIFEQTKKRKIGRDRNGKGLVLDHTCNNRNCVSLSHLQEVTQSINCLMIARRGADSAYCPPITFGPGVQIFVGAV